MQAGAVHIVMLIVGRIFLGAGIGLANQVICKYLLSGYVCMYLGMTELML